MSSVTTPFDRVVSLLVDATNALTEAEGEYDLSAWLTRNLNARLDAALREACKQQDAQIRLATEDGPDPDRLRDEWLEDAGRQ